MAETAPTIPAPEPAAATPDSPAGATPENPNPTPAEETKPDGFKSEESKNAVLADLAKERDARQALEQQLADLAQRQEAQNKALAEAFGLTEPPKTEDDITATVSDLKARLDQADLKARRLEVAAEFKIPAEHHDLLTETDPEKLRAQAEKVGSLVAAQAAATGNPQFQPNPGQGQGGGGPAKQDDSYPSHWVPKKHQGDS